MNPGRAVRRATTLVGATGTALVLAAAPALAGVTIVTDGIDTVSITSNAAADMMKLRCLSDTADVNGAFPQPSMPCEDVGFVEVEAGGGKDTVDLGAATLADFPALRQTEIDVKDTSADTVTGSEARDVVEADSNDTVTLGNGDDWVEGAGSAVGGPGNDTLRQIPNSVQAGPGDDLVVNPGAGPIDGGDGRDTVVLDYSAFTSQLALGVTINDASINGSITTSSIEDYDLTASDGVRADSVDSRAYSGRVTFHGRSGDDTFLGGPGADFADLGAGNDTADPGPGSDFVLGGDGDDTVFARDGFGDLVDCGPGNDTVSADRADVLSGCENVTLPPPDTSLINGIKKVTKGPKTVFTFASSVAGAVFECQVDVSAYKACASPYRIRTKKLQLGKHTLTVRAVQPAGNADQSPSVFTFKVVKKKKVTTRGDRAQQ